MSLARVNRMTFTLDSLEEDFLLFIETENQYFNS